MMSYSLWMHAVMLTVFNLVSTTPRFHHPFCLRARLLTLTSLLGASSSVPSFASGFPCSFLLRLAFPQQTVFPRVQTLLMCSPPSLVALGCTQLNLLVPELCVRIPPAPLHPGHPTREEGSWSLLVPPEPDYSVVFCHPCIPVRAIPTSLS
jgi:hypothetical protein